ncbi:TRAP transporter substrate-binding protein [Terasakiella pusilla]|uniref:TRAP transporter substrate-binding protein n=1 Tax=Terasakiella pusilla TaxID=64973 RepID=UPI000491DDF4|nr:TRAP transporter substrate-binding protein [Terasakiella pusilla]
MKTTRRNLLGMFAAAAVSVATFAHASAAEVTLRFHHFLPPQANMPKTVFSEWKSRIEKDSGGRLKIQEFPAMQLGGKPPELIDQAVDGVADIIWTLSGYTPGRFPIAEVFELPFLLKDAESASRAYWQFAQENMQEELKDIHPLALWVHGPGVIHSNKPVNTIEDLKGLKLRAPTRITNAMFKSLGATPVGMPVPAVPEALSKGVVDGTVLPWELTGAFKIPELVKNHTMFDGEFIYTSTFIMGMNKDAYNNLPADLKAVLDKNSGLELSGWFGKMIQSFDEPTYNKTKEAGNTIINVTGADLDEWKAKAQPTIDQWVADMNAKGKDGATLLKRAKEILAENTK